MRLRRLLSKSALSLGLLLSAGLPAVTRTALAAETSVPLPFDRGEAVQIVQGYNGGTHQDASVYGLDLVLADGTTSGARVLSPFDGSVPWAFAPGEKTGCIEILATDGQFGTMLCHIILDRPFNHGEKVVRGQQLGTVGAPGMVGNNGLAHVHMELHQHGRSSDIVPFSASNGGLPLEDADLPFTGGVNEHGGEGPIVSTTAYVEAPVAVAAPAPAQSSPRSAPGTSKGKTAQPASTANHCAPGMTPTFSLGFASVKAQLGDLVGDATSCEFADPSGSGDVLQQTSHGLAFWRKSSNTPTFTNGNDHWALTPGGVVTWTGASIDPPATATAVGAA